jgi:hypothetical protein
MFSRFCIVLAGLLGLTLVPSSLALPSDTNTLLLLHFENSLNGAGGQAPTSATGVSYEPGVAGNGAWFASGDWDKAIRENRGLQRPPGVQLPAGSLTVSNGLFQCRLTGDAGFDYVVEATMNFSQWIAVTNMSNFTGDSQVSDICASPQRFYRAKCLP